MTTFVLRNANLLDLEQGNSSMRMEVVVTDGKIVDVDRRSKTPASADAVYDVRGQTLMPGLIDCHVHCMASHVNLALTARMSNAIGDHPRAADPEGHAEAAASPPSATPAAPTRRWRRRPRTG